MHQQYQTPNGVELTETGVLAVERALGAFAAHWQERGRKATAEQAEDLCTRMWDALSAETEVDIGREARADAFLVFEGADEWDTFHSALTRFSDESAAGPTAVCQSTRDLLQQVLDGAY